jgi:hypothetical protein
VEQLEKTAELANFLSNELARLAFDEKCDVDTSLLLENFSFDAFKMANTIKEISYNLGGLHVS